MQWAKQTTTGRVCTGVALPTFYRRKKTLTPATNHSSQLQTAAARLKGSWENCRESWSMNLSGKNSFSSSHTGFCPNTLPVPLHLSSCTRDPQSRSLLLPSTLKGKSCNFTALRWHPSQLPTFCMLWKHSRQELAVQIKWGDKFHLTVEQGLKFSQQLTLYVANECPQGPALLQWSKP